MMGSAAARVFTRRIVLVTKGMESPRGASTGEEVTGVEDGGSKMIS